MIKVNIPNQTNKYIYVHDANKNDLDILKETWVIDVYRVRNESPRTVVDVGANYGGFTTNISSKANKIISVEPEQSNLDLLRANIELFNINDKVIIDTHAIGGSTRDGTINSAAGGSSIYEVNENTQAIKIITLKKLLELHNLNEVDILKIDVEGAEKEILLETPSNILSKFKYITAEFDNRAEGDITLSIEHLKQTHDVEIIGTPDRGGMIYARKH